MIRYNFDMKKGSKKSKSLSNLAPTEHLRPEPIRFQEFFARKLLRNELKAWQRAEIKAFFTDLRLKDKELEEVFESALRHY